MSLALGYTPHTELSPSRAQVRATHVASTDTEGEIRFNMGQEWGSPISFRLKIRILRQVIRPFLSKKQVALKIRIPRYMATLILE